VVVCYFRHILNEINKAQAIYGRDWILVPNNISYIIHFFSKS